MNNRQVAHVWAQQNGRDARGSNFFSAGVSIFSYGAHFEIARFVERRGARAVLFTTRGYSVSTSRHISYARSALHGLDVPVFNVLHLDRPPLDNFRDYAARVAETAESAARARRNAEWKMERAQALADEANAFAEFFGMRQRIARPELTPELRARVIAQRERAKKENAEREAKAFAARSKAAMEFGQQVAEWRKGGALPIPGAYFPYGRMGFSMPDLLRVRGDVIETSRGAEFPADHGRRAFPLIARVRERGETWRTNGHSIHLGHFRIDEIDAGGNVRAGCHYVEWSEIEACARALGLVQS